MAEEEKDLKTTEAAEEAAEDTSAAPESAPEAEESAESQAAAPTEPDPLDDLSPKERRRLLKSRRPHKPRPPRTPEERKAERDAERKRKAAQRRKRRAEAKEKEKAAKGKREGTPPVVREPNSPKTRQGVVVSNKADKTITVRIDIARRHKIYEKVVRQSRTLHVHDERNEASEGDTVRVVETRPLSKTKRWRLVEIVEKAR